MKSLVEALIATKSKFPEKGITFIESGSQSQFISYSELYDSALSILGLLQENGIQKGDHVILQLDQNEELLKTFWACILGGMIAIPLSVGNNDDHKHKLFNVVRKLGNPFIVISPVHVAKIRSFAEDHALTDLFRSMESRLLLAGNSGDVAQLGSIAKVVENDLAFIQFSSGSTGSPKGVMLTHANLLTNINSISCSAGYRSDESMISWMPLTHDMGMIGFHLNPLVEGMDHCLVATQLFIRRPGIWLEMAAKLGASILCSPNFGLKYVLKHCALDGREQWDLSRVRILYNGAEPIVESICSEFSSRLHQYHLHTCAMRPVYGLAEASLAVSMSAVGTPVNTVALNRTRLNVSDDVVVLEKSAPDALTFVSVGKPVADCHVRLTDDQDNPVKSGIVGHLQIKGANVTNGYYNDTEVSAGCITGDGWFRTGDLAFMYNEEIFIVGRSKDIVFVNGLNYYPHDLEVIAATVEGVELNKVVIGSIFSPSLQREVVLAFVLFRKEAKEFAAIAKEIAQRVSHQAGVTLDQIIPVKDIPRTTSGKLQRHKLLDQYRNGDFAGQEVSIQGSPVSGSAIPSDDQLFAMWKTALSTHDISPDDNFFSLGGNSLKAAELCMLIHRQMEVDLPVTAIFEFPTFTAFSANIHQYQKQNYAAIEHQSSGGPYRATPEQEYVFYAASSLGRSTAYNLPVALSINSTIDEGKLRNCLQIMIERHDILRINLVYDDQLYCHVRSADKVELAVRETTTNLLHSVLKSLVIPFDLSHGPLYRFALIRHSANQCVFFLDFHHAIADGSSIANFIREVFALYKGEASPARTVQFQDFAHWRATHESSFATRRYWESVLDQGNRLDLVPDFKRPHRLDGSGEKVAFEIPASDMQFIRNCAYTNKTSIHVVMLTAYFILLNKYTGRSSQRIGLPLAGRDHLDVNDAQGMFVKNLPLQVELGGNLNFAEALSVVHQKFLQLMQHQDVSPMELLALAKTTGMDAMFDTMFVFQNFFQRLEDNNSLGLQRYFFDPGFAKFDISMEIFETSSGAEFYIEYATALFRHETILAFGEAYKRLLTILCTNESGKISGCSLLDAKHLQALAQFNNTRRPYSQPRNVWTLFENQYLTHPEKIALVAEKAELTYRDLYEAVVNVSKALGASGVTTDSHVVVLLPRSERLIVTILAIMRTGGTYVPLDVNTPEDRINFIVSDSRAATVITDAGYKQKLIRKEYHDRTVIFADLAKVTETAAEKATHGEMAYIIYTSGTTGSPKGVLVSQHALTNYLLWAAEAYCSGQPFAMPLFTSISFDLTVTSIFLPLITGNTLVVYEEQEIAPLLSRILADNKVNCLKATPSHLKLFKNFQALCGDSAIRKIIVGGEQLSAALAKQTTSLFGKQLQIFNEYGPTEATVGCMIHLYDETESGDNVPIGVPAANTEIYLLDDALQPVTPGICGELYIAGDCLASGYVFNEPLTIQKFVENPFRPRQRMYRTGDFAKRLADGKLEYLGRRDQQIKINGYRIELQEIETALNVSGFFHETVVTVSKTEEPLIVAYYLGDREIDAREIRRYLLGKLPHYMMPVHFVRLNKIPLTKNGKVDFNALPVPIDNTSQGGLQTALEQSFIAIWKEIFDREDIGVDDNFFDLGGDSIKAVQVSSRLARENITVTVKDILVFQTIAAIAAESEPRQRQHYEQYPVNGEVPMSPIQSWFFSFGHSCESFFNQSVLLELHEDVHQHLLERAVRMVILRHDALRLNVDRKNNSLFFNPAHLNLPEVISKVSARDQQHFTACCTALKNSMDITRDLLIKAAIIEHYTGVKYFLLTAHHLVIDGVSWRIILDDMLYYYHTLAEGKEIQPLPKTASLADVRREAGTRFTEHEVAERAYWQKQTGEIFMLPFDHDTNDWRVANRSTRTLQFNIEQTTTLRTSSHHNYGTDLHMVILAALSFAIRDWSGHTQIIVENENHGRHLASLDLTRTVGWMTTMHPLQINAAYSTFPEMVGHIRNVLSQVPDHGINYRYPAQGSRSMIRFNYLGQFGRELNNELFSYVPDGHGPECSPDNLITTVIDVNCMIISDQLRIDFSYNQLTHQAATISSIMENIRKILLENTRDIADLATKHFGIDLAPEELNSLFR
jgi:amino acid adenylation domain-containing protein/non-ribosomal peptide synthase protein (TIGR01720 family)